MERDGLEELDATEKASRAGLESCLGGEMNEPQRAAEGQRVYL